MYSRMVLSRGYEERLAAAYMEGKTPLFNMANGPLPGEMHLSNGQEPCAVGVCAHLGADDVITATHRPHHIAIAKGVDLQAMTAEIFGKKAGLSGGRGGHMHIFDPKVNFACSGIIAQGMGPAAGAALARKLRGEPGVAVAFIGEGAANQGAFHEVMNIAALWKLPFVCVIEDNAWGVSVAKSQSTAVARNDVRAAAYGIPGVYVPGNDPYAIYAAAGEAIARARAGGGPTLIEIETWRLAGHFMGDVEGYRPAGEKEALFARDPIPAMRQRMIAEKTATAEDVVALEAEAKATLDEVFNFARAAAEPQPEEALEKVFV
ncbi:MAG: pyruvate dehydrogenase (acetyl-transferring) E1 component subunit alpha [Proteobacteria bacterium]|jgi:pyruvate dehydrogenase E1 component alpha subunit|nr:MAG: pyruvate dehydrogenase (acetyl-transferring) E1 component subunit alpha [Pseudomonadota bacterium]